MANSIIKISLKKQMVMAWVIVAGVDQVIKEPGKAPTKPIR